MSNNELTTDRKQFEEYQHILASNKILDLVIYLASEEDVTLIRAFFDNAKIEPHKTGTRSLAQPGWRAELPLNQGYIALLRANPASPLTAIYIRDRVLVMDARFEADEEGIALFAGFLRKVAEETQKL